MRDLENSPDAGAIIHAVLGLGHSLGMTTCAEGVETNEQLSFLRSEACAEIQGYIYSKPKPIDQIARLIEAGQLKLCGRGAVVSGPQLQPDISPETAALLRD